MPAKNSKVSARTVHRVTPRVAPATSHRRAPMPVSTTPASAPPAGRRLLPIKCAAERLGLSVWGLRRMVYDSRISSHKIGNRLMLSEDAIDRFIAESERPAMA